MLILRCILLLMILTQIFKDEFLNTLFEAGFILLFSRIKIPRTNGLINGSYRDNVFIKTNINNVKFYDYLNCFTNHSLLYLFQMMKSMLSNFNFINYQKQSTERKKANRDHIINIRNPNLPLNVLIKNLLSKSYDPEQKKRITAPRNKWKTKGIILNSLTKKLEK